MKQGLTSWSRLAFVLQLVLTVWLAWDLFFGSFVPYWLLLALLAVAEWALVVIGRLQGRDERILIVASIAMTILAIASLITPESRGLLRHGAEMGWW